MTTERLSKPMVEEAHMSQVAEQLSRLYTTVAGIEASLAMLEDSLVTVLRLTDKTNPEGLDCPSQLVPLAVDLDSLNERLLYVTRGFQSVNDRLEL